PPIRLTVSVATENFAVEGAAHADLVVPLTGKSSAVHFRLRGLKPGPGRIMVDFTQGGRPVGSVDLYPEVVGKRARAIPLLVPWLALLALPALSGALGASVPESRDGRPATAAYASVPSDGPLWFFLGSVLLLCSLLLWAVLRRRGSRAAARVEGERRLT